MNTELIEKKEQIKKSLQISLLLVNDEITELKKSEKPELTSRQKQFSRDDAQPLVNKYKSNKYENYKHLILEEITKKFENVKKRKEKTDKIYSIYKKFFDELNTKQS